MELNFSQKGKIKEIAEKYQLKMMLLFDLSSVLIRRKHQLLKERIYGK